jgi:hypothetical protein
MSISWTAAARSWGSTPEERSLAFPGDENGDPNADILFRGVTVEAPAPTVFRWLCQLRAAPYSYDWIDNAGRRSPPTLTPGLERLERGQTVMAIFRLEDFRAGEWLVFATPAGSRAARLFGVVDCTYWARTVSTDRTRLLVKLRVSRAPGLWGGLLRAILPWGDLLMMRRQLLNLKRLAESASIAR